MGMQMQTLRRELQYHLIDIGEEEKEEEVQGEEATRRHDQQ